MSDSYHFTSESVSEGHPDKVADRKTAAYDHFGREQPDFTCKRTD
jgi:S-adenosylmethionine synthetase